MKRDRRFFQQVQTTKAGEPVFKALLGTLGIEMEPRETLTIELDVTVARSIHAMLAENPEIDCLLAFDQADGRILRDAIATALEEYVPGT